MTSDDRLYPARPILAVSLAVFRGDRVLLAQRAAAPMADLFTLPGGLVEPGESMGAAALREIQEEVGVEADIVAFNDHVEVIEHDASGGVRRHYVIASFIGVWRAGEGMVGPEARAVVWAKRDEIAGMATTKGLLPLLDRAWTIAERVHA